MTLDSLDGHDGFLLASEDLGKLMTERLRERCSWIYAGPPLIETNGDIATAVKDSVFSEVESDW